MIEVSNLSKKFGDFYAVQDVSFSYQPGNVLGFIGPNGAGKSTTLKCLAALLDPDSGEVKFKGKLINENLSAYRRSFGYLPEGNPLLEELKVKEYLKYIHTLKGGEGRCPDEAIDLCGLAEVKDMPIVKLSKGFKQRTGIATAILSSPELLLFDEPVNGLDPEQIINVRKLFQYLAEEAVLIISSHILSELEMICADFLIIAAARIKAFGTKEDIFKNAGSESRLILSLQGDYFSLIKTIESLPAVISVREEDNSISVVFNNDQDPRGDIYNLIRREEDVALQEFFVEKRSLEQIYLEMVNE